MAMAAERQESNRKIIRLLAEMIEKHADQRSGQLLINSGVFRLETATQKKPRVSDPFYEESLTTLRRVLKTCQATGTGNL